VASYRKCAFLFAFIGDHEEATHLHRHSVIGGCFNAELSEWPNGLPKDLQQAFFMPILSDILATEIQNAPEAVRRKYESHTNLGRRAQVPVVTEEVIELGDLSTARDPHCPSSMMMVCTPPGAPLR
jgi:hypothetical protein